MLRLTRNIIWRMDKQMSDLKWQSPNELVRRLKAGRKYQVRGRVLIFILGLYS